MELCIMRLGRRSSWRGVVGMGGLLSCRRWWSGGNFDCYSALRGWDIKDYGSV